MSNGWRETKELKPILWALVNKHNHKQNRDRTNVPTRFSDLLAAPTFNQSKGILPQKYLLYLKIKKKIGSLSGRGEAQSELAGR